MEEYRIANEWMEDIMNGKRKADDAPKMVQDWFMLTIYNIAKRVVERPTKQGRINALNDVKSYAPSFMMTLSG